MVRIHDRGNRALIMESSNSTLLYLSQENQDRVVRIFKQLILRRHSVWVNSLLTNTHPKDIANLWDFFSTHEQEVILSILPVKHSADLISEINQGHRENIFRTKSIDWVVERLQCLEIDDVAEILRRLPEREANFIIKKFGGKYFTDIQDLLNYPEETAGSLMNPDFLALPYSTTISRSIQKCRKLYHAKQLGEMDFIYIVDKNNRLMGYLPLSRLFLEKPSQKLQDIMLAIPVKIKPYLDQEDVAKIFKDYDFVSVPVVDKHDILLGRITIDDIVDVLESEANEDVHKIMGLSTEKGINSVFSSFKNRLPWMFVNLVTTSIAAILISLFETTLSNFVVLVAFIPMVAALGGATGNQMVAMIIRSLSMGELRFKQIKTVIVREVTSVILGASCIAVIILVVIEGMYQNLWLAVVLSISLIFTMVLATLLGVFIPFMLKLCKQDPALGSSILVAACTDIIGVYTFLVLSTYLYR